MAKIIQPSFARGEIPELQGRVDTAVYRIGLAIGFNFVIHVSGGASNRPGLLFVGPVKDHTKTVRIIPFKFKTTDTYNLEFGDLYMRVIRNDAHVSDLTKTITGITQANPAVVSSASHTFTSGQEVVLSDIVGMTELNLHRVKVANVTAGTYEIQDQVTGAGIDSTAFGAYISGGQADRVFELATPYAEADLAKLKFAQSADVVTLTHPLHQPRELSRTDHDVWTLTEVSYVPRQIHPTGLTATQNGTPGAETYRYRVAAIADETFEESLPALNSATITITGATQADPVVITASNSLVVGEDVLIDGVVGMTEINGRRFTVANPTGSDFELKGENGTGYAAYTSAGTAKLALVKVTDGNATLSATDNIAVSWLEAASTQRYVIYKEENGLYGLLGETEALTFTDDGSKTPNLANSPQRFREPFSGTDNAPAAVGHYQQRRVFGGANSKPDTSDYSRTGDQSNFTTATPAKPDDAMRATLSSLEVNEIRHYVPLNDLLVLTSGEEWRIDSGDNNRFSADTLRQNPQSSWGASHVRPAVVGSVVLFVQENNSAVRSIGFELAVDGYKGTDMSLLSNHLLRDNEIVDSAYVRSPDPVVYYVRDDGVVLAMTFDQDQEVIAWTRWATRTPDEFEAVSAVRPISSGGGVTEKDDAAFFVVKRTIGGNTVRYIERTHSRRFVAIEDAFFVDSGLTFDQPLAISGATQADPVVLSVPSGHGLVAADEVDISDIKWVPLVDEFGTETQPAQLNGGRFKVNTATATTISLDDLEGGGTVDGTAFNAYVSGGNVRKAVTTLSGFHHLAGESVVALADGNVVRDLTVSADGELTLPRKFSRVHVGFEYLADLGTLDISTTQELTSTIQGDLRNVHGVSVKLARSRGLWSGPDENDMVEWKQRENELYGEPTRLFTGNMELTIPAAWNSNGRVLLRQRDPLPITILSVTPIFETEKSSDE